MIIPCQRDYFIIEIELLEDERWSARMTTTSHGDFMEIDRNPVTAIKAALKRVFETASKEDVKLDAPEFTNYQVGWWIHIRGRAAAQAIANGWDIPRHQIDKFYADVIDGVRQEIARRHMPGRGFVPGWQEMHV